MGRVTWLAQVLRDAGLAVNEVAGWQTRGGSIFSPSWQVFHHTASAAGADAPALGICVNGRSDLPGPLCNVLVARSGVCHVVASGRANHAGAGRYPDGSTGNSLSIGWECENNGVGEPWPAGQLDAIARGQAAVAARLAQPASSVIYHRTYAPGRKPDPAGPGIPQDVRDWQARVAGALIDPTGGFGNMTDAEIDAKFLTLKIELDQAREDIANLSKLAKQHNEGNRRRFDKLLAAIDAK